MKVLIDTNFLIDLFRFKLDLSELTNHDLYTITPVVKELEKIASSKTNESKYAKLALQFLDKIKIIECKGDVDTCLLGMVPEFAVATNDAALRKKLKEKNAKIIYLRSKKELIL